MSGMINEVFASCNIAKLIFMGSCLYTVGSTFLAGLNAFIEMLGHKGENIMIFGANVPGFALWLGLAIGIAVTVLISYVFDWQDYMKKHDTTVKFDKNYIIAAILTTAVSVFAGWVCVTFGLAYVWDGKIINEPEVAFLLTMAIGAVTAYLIDAWAFHKIADGTMAASYNKSQEAVREQLDSEATQKAIFSAVAKKANSLGLVDDAKIKTLSSLVADENDGNFATYVQLLLNQKDTKSADTAADGASDGSQGA